MQSLRGHYINICSCCPGSDAIWSHRWYVALTAIGAGGPVLDDGSVLLTGGRTGVPKWVEYSKSAYRFYP